jgi:hypothetical protein
VALVKQRKDSSDLDLLRMNEKRIPLWGHRYNLCRPGLLTFKAACSLSGTVAAHSPDVQDHLIKGDK